MENENLDEVIAERELSLALDEGRVATVIVKLGMPRQVAGRDVWRCHFQFVGLDNDKIRYAEGADSMQAITLALTKIGSRLYTSEAFKSERLTAQGARNLGFPAFVSDPLSELVPDPIGLLRL